MAIKYKTHWNLQNGKYRSWEDAVTALRIRWSLFMNRWNDFCYPSSDDVIIFPKHGDWVAAFHHTEMFEFYKKVKGCDQLAFS